MSTKLFTLVTSYSKETLRVLGLSFKRTCFHRTQQCKQRTSLGSIVKCLSVCESLAHILKFWSVENNLIFGLIKVKRQGLRGIMMREAVIVGIITLSDAVIAVHGKFRNLF